MFSSGVVLTSFMLTILPIPFLWWLYLSSCLGRIHLRSPRSLSGTLPLSLSNWGRFFTRLLRVFEWCSLKLADITIATNESYKQVQMERAKRDPRTIFIVRNGPDKLRMSPVQPSPRLKAMNKCILCYVGSLNPQDGVDYLLRSLRYLSHDLKRSDFHCVIMGTGDSLQDLRDLAGTLQLNGCVELTALSPMKICSPTLRPRILCGSRSVEPSERRIYLDQDHGIYGLCKAHRFFRSKRNAVFRR